MNDPHTNGHGPTEHVPMPGQRDLGFERRWTAQAATSVHADHERLSDYAEARAGSGPVIDLDSRNFAREVAEELADARNYLCWWAQQLAARDDHQELAGEINQEIGQALSAVALAYEHAARARALTIEWRRGRA